MRSFWTDEETAFVREGPDTTRVYDLRERTARFGEAVIDFANKRTNEPRAHSSFVIPLSFVIRPSSLYSA